MMKLKEEHNWDWEANEREILTNINEIIKLPLQQLWDPPMVEEEFVRYCEFRNSVNCDDHIGIK